MNAKEIGVGGNIYVVKICEANHVRKPEEK